MPIGDLIRGFRMRAAAALAGGSVIAEIQAGTMQTPPRRSAWDMLRLFRRAPWLRAVSTKIADDVSGIVFTLHATRNKASGRFYRHLPAQSARAAQRREIFRQLKAAGDLVEITDHPMLAMLERGNPILPGWQGMRLTELHLQLAGEAVWIIDRDRLGVPFHYWPVPATWISKIPEYPGDTFTLSYRGVTRDYDQRDIVWFKDPDPENPYGRGSGIVQSLDTELATDEYTAKHISTFFYNSARPDLIIQALGMNEGAMRRFAGQWITRFQGVAKRYLPFFTNQEVKVTPISQTFEEMKLIELRRFQRDLVLEVYGAAKEKFGIVENSNRSTIDAADYHWQSDVVEPRADFIRGVLQQQLAPQFDERLIVSFLSPVKEDYQRRMDAMSKQPGAFMVDDYREAAGLEPLPNGKGQVFAVPFNVRMVRDLEEKPPAPESPAPPGAPPEDEPEGEEEPAEAEDTDEGDPEKAAPAGARTRSLLPAEIDFLIRSIDPDVVIEAVTPELREAIETLGAYTLAEIGAGISFDLSDPAVVEFLEAEAAKRVVGINETTRANVREAVTQGVAAGESVANIALRVQDSFAQARGVRAFTIARTETMVASNFAADRALAQARIEFKEWLATPDEVTREEHRDLGGLEGGEPARVRTTEEFRVSSGPNAGATAAYPGGFGIAELDINCRCSVVAHFPDGEGKSTLTGEMRTAYWRAFENQREPFERRIVYALRRAFDEQERAALRALQGE